MSYGAIIREAIEKVAREQKVEISPLADDLPLLESGLNSLCWAIVIARMEQTAGFDPFAELEGAFPVTLGDFIAAYDNGAK